MSGEPSIDRCFLLSIVVGSTLVGAETNAQREVIEFGPERWEMESAEIVTRFGRECVTGAAIGKGIPLALTFPQMNGCISSWRSPGRKLGSL